MRLRDALCRLVRDIQPRPPDLVPAVIELHARMLLTGGLGGDADDAARLRVLGEAVRIVNEHRLEILRVAYLNRTQIATALRGDPKLDGVTFSGIMRGLCARMEEMLVVPVIDGVPGSAPERRRPPSIDPVLIRAFARNVRYLHHMRQYETVAAHLAVENAHNIGEPVFADSAHSVFLQLADLVSYLLLQIDRDELESGAPQSDYRQAVIRNAKAIDNALVGSWRGIMQGDIGALPA